MIVNFLKRAARWLFTGERTNARVNPHRPALQKEPSDDFGNTGEPQRDSTRPNPPSGPALDPMAEAARWLFPKERATGKQQTFKNYDGQSVIRESGTIHRLTGSGVLWTLEETANAVTGSGEVIPISGLKAICSNPACQGYETTVLRCDVCQRVWCRGHFVIFEDVFGKHQLCLHDCSEYRRRFNCWAAEDLIRKQRSKV